MASNPIPNYPSDLTMNDFRAINNDYGSLAKSCRFAARLRPASPAMQFYGSFMRDFTYLCEVGELPGRSFISMDVRYYGPNQKLPFQTQYDDLNLSFLVRTESFEKEFFDDWMTIINPNNTWDFSYRDTYTAMIDLYQFADDGDDEFGPRATYWATCHNVYPLIVNPMPMTWADDQFQRVVVSFTYTHWTRPNRDPVPRRNRTSTGHSFNLVEGRGGNETRASGPHWGDEHYWNPFDT
jgi:hypothetical protein